jgi:predicted dehydrogenase
MSIGVALYGSNGHQLGAKHFEGGRARPVAVCELRDELIAPLAKHGPRRCATLEEMIATPGVDLVVLCSPRRRDQAADAKRCLEAGKHAYVEKPAAFTEAELDELLATAERRGVKFHEMAGTAFHAPYAAMRELVQRGDIGEVVQAFAQKSYPFHDRRPQDEDADGGLTMQAGVHGVRMIEHVTGLRTEAVDAMQTRRGNPRVGEAGAGLRIAAVMMLRLQGGALAAVTANYLNPRGTGIWGYEELRVFGTKGMVEAYDGGRLVRVTIGETPPLTLEANQDRDWFDYILDELIDGKPMPLSLEDELHPTRVVIRARAAAEKREG